MIFNEFYFFDRFFQLSPWQHFYWVWRGC